MKQDDTSYDSPSIGYEPIPTLPRASQAQMNLSTTRPTDSDLLSRQLLSQPDAQEVDGITGNDVASFALSRSTKVLSTLDLNTIGLALLQSAVASADLKAASSIFATMASVNSKKVTEKSKGGGPNPTLAKALHRAAKGMAPQPASRQTVQLAPEMPEGIEDV